MGSHTGDIREKAHTHTLVQFIHCVLTRFRFRKWGLKPLTMKYYTLFLILILFDVAIGQDILQDGENLLEDIETGTEEAVTEVEMEDVTMTTPITTPAAKEVSNKVIITTPAPVVDIENEESLNEEQDLEMNQESISQEKIPRKLSVIVEDDVYDVADDVSEDADDISDIEDRSDKDDISSDAK